MQAELTPSSARAGITRRPDPMHLMNWLVVLGSLGLCYRDTLFYSVALRGENGYLTIIRGIAPAPDQYRIGVVFAAYWIMRHLHLNTARAFGLLDFLGLILAVLLLGRLLARSTVYRRSSVAVQWAGAAAFAAMVLFYLNWDLWYTKVGTLPTAGVVAVMLWMWTRSSARPASGVRQAVTALSFLALAIVQGFERADVALVVCVGVFLLTLTPAGHGLSLPRGLARVVSFIAAVASAAIQVYLSKVVYPHATYQDTPLFMLLYDYMKPMLWFAFLVFIAPFFWTVVQVVRRRFSADAAAVAFMLGGMLYVVLWVVLGRLDEVRIFIPMGLALAPLLAEMLMLYIEPAELLSAPVDQVTQPAQQPA